MHDRSRIGPVAYGLSLYLLISVLDTLNIPAVGSFLKIAALVPLGMMLFQVKDLRLRLHSLVLAQIAFWFLALVSLFYTVSFDRTYGADTTLTLNVLLVLALGAMVPYNREELDLLQKAMLWGCWIQILLTLVFADYSAGGRLTLRFGSSDQDQNNNNTYFLYAFSWHCYRMLTGREKKQIIPVLVMMTMVLLSGSRGALVAFAMVFFFQICLFFGGSRHAMRKIFAVAALMLVVALSFEFILRYLPESVSVRFSLEYLEEKGTTGRSKTWAFLWNYFKESNMLRMLFGNGYGTTALINEIKHRVAHNLYLDNLMTLGIVGLTLQLISQGMVLHIFRKHRKYELMGGFVGMIGMCLSLSLTASKPIWNMMLIALALDCNPVQMPETETKQENTQ